MAGLYRYPMAMKRKRLDEDSRWTSHIAPAPGELKIVQALVNTAVLRTGTEELAGPRALGRWLALWRLAPEDAEPSAVEVEIAVAVREGLRAMFWANNGFDLDVEAVERLDRAAAEVPLRLRVGGEGVAYLTASAVEPSLLGRLLGLVGAARFGASWRRFKACADRSCGSAFYDATKNHSARWCSPRCSNRVAARAWRRRQAARR